MRRNEHLNSFHISKPKKAPFEAVKSDETPRSIPPLLTVEARRSLRGESCLLRLFRDLSSPAGSDRGHQEGLYDVFTGRYSHTYSQIKVAENADEEENLGLCVTIGGGWKKERQQPDRNCGFSVFTGFLFCAL